MRLAPLLVSCLVAAATASQAFGADVILKDGSSIATAKPYAVKGKMAILTRPDGSLVSIPVEDIDVPKTAAAAGAKPAAPEATPAPAAARKPQTPAEAAKAKPAKKATVVLTDAELGRNVSTGPEGEKQEKGEGEVSIGSVSATRNKTGYSIVGSVVNSGKADVRGVGVTIELVGENNKTMQTLFGNVAKDNLAPGEKSAFTAEVASETEARNFRYVPSWQVTVSVKAAEPGASKAEPSSSAQKPPPAPPEQNPAPGSAPKAEKEGPQEPKYIPRPDIAPPAASVPVGAPTAPGGIYVPRPSDNQAGQPKTP